LADVIDLTGISEKSKPSNLCDPKFYNFSFYFW
jgi:hypothetical protein